MNIISTWMVNKAHSLSFSQQLYNYKSLSESETIKLAKLVFLS